MPFYRRTIAFWALFCAAIGRQGRASAAGPSELATSGGGIIALDSPAVRIALKPSAGLEGLRRRLAGLGSGERVFLVLRDLHAAAQPGVVFDIYLGLPPGPVMQRSELNPVGQLNFFAVAPPSPGRSISRSYDVTDTILRLSSQGLTGDRLAATIAAGDATSFNSQAQATIGEIALIVE